MEGKIPITRALRVMGECAKELVARPSEDDILTLMARGGEGAREFSWLSAALDAIKPQEYAALYTIQSVLFDEEVRATAGELPEDTAARLVAVIERLEFDEPTSKALTDRSNQEQLLRLVAMALGLGFLGEREATTRFLLTSLDATTNKLDAEVKSYNSRLTSARTAIDNKHRPARPYGE